MPSAWRRSEPWWARRFPIQVAAMQAVAFGGFLLVFLLSGLMFPIENIPAGLRWISNLIWGRYYIEIVRDALLQGGRMAGHVVQGRHHRRDRRGLLLDRVATRCAACSLRRKAMAPDLQLSRACPHPQGVRPDPARPPPGVRADPSSHAAIAAAGVCPERRRDQHQARSGGRQPNAREPRADRHAEREQELSACQLLPFRRPAW